MYSSFPQTRHSKPDELAEQVISINSSPIMDTLLKTASGLLLVINERREVVTINQAFLESIGITDSEELLGLRMGEILKCIHADEGPDGCGSTKYCATCGAAIAMMSAMVQDKPMQQLCALTAAREGVTQEHALLVKAHPLMLEGRRWILMYAQDVSKQLLLEEFEKALLHDLSGSMVDMMTASQTMLANNNDSAAAWRLARYVSRIHGEILMLRRLYLGKTVDMSLIKQTVTLNDIRQEIADIVTPKLNESQVQLTEVWPSDNVAMETDLILLTRVIMHMLLNAMEATQPGGTIRLEAVADKGNVTWSVWNNAHIPEAVQLRIFQKYFSTKAQAGRGLGTYTMKLFGETYLNGTVSFRSSAESGTTFSFVLPHI